MITLLSTSSSNLGKTPVQETVAGFAVGCAGWSTRPSGPVGSGKAMREALLRFFSRLRRCGLDCYIPKAELQEASAWEHKHANALDRINRELMKNTVIKNYWLARGRQMGVVK